MKKQIIVLFSLLTLTVFIGSVMALLPQGQNSHNSDCSFMTNFQSSHWSLNDYNDVSPELGWIALDVNNDGQKEIFGWSSSGYICPEAGYAYKLLPVKALGNFKIEYNVIFSHQLFICDGDNAIVFWRTDEWNIPVNPTLTCDKSKTCNKGDCYNIPNSNKHEVCLGNGKWGGAVKGHCIYK